MSDRLNNDKDDLEDFFRDRLHAFQDEPSIGVWDKIERQIPKKPIKRYQPLLLWTSRGVAVCLIFTLFFVNYQYRNQLDFVASELKSSKNSMATLEGKINAYTQKLLTDNTQEIEITEVNKPRQTNPRPQLNSKRIITQIRNQPPTNDNPLPISTHSLSLLPPPSQEDKIIAQSPEVPELISVVTSAKNDLKSVHKKKSSNTVLALHQNQLVNQKDLLDLSKNIASPKIMMAKKQLVSPNTLRYKKTRKWVINHNKVKQQFPSSSIVSQQYKKNKGNGEYLNAVVSIAQQNKKIDWEKVVGVGANYTIGARVSFFLGPDYSEASKQTVRHHSNNLYPYTVGLESGITYRF